MVLDKQTAQAHIALVLFDLTLVRLRIHEELIPPSGTLRESARAFGPRLMDRIRGLDVMLRFYESFRHASGEFSCLEASEIDEIKPSRSLLRLIDRALPPGTITAIDEARYLVMKSFLAEKRLTSSFTVDELFKKLIQMGRLIPFRGAYSTIDSLIVDGIAAGALARTGGV
jgi:hypothetical protein